MISFYVLYEDKNEMYFFNMLPISNLFYFFANPFQAHQCNQTIAFKTQKEDRKWKS